MFSIPSFSIGFVAGFGTGFLTREIASTGAAVVRPLTKAAMKASMMIYEKSRETLAHFSETLEDLVAEAKSEVAAPAVATATPVGEHVDVSAVEMQKSHETEGASHAKGKDKHKVHARKEHA